MTDSFDVTVKSHTTTRKADEEPTFKVELQTTGKLLPGLKLTLKSNEEDVFEAYPLHKKFTVTFSQPQKRLDE